MPTATGEDAAAQPKSGRRAGRRRAAEQATPEQTTPQSWPARPPDPAEQAREICLGLLADRPRTRAELATALRRRGIADDVAAQVLDRYDEVGIVDDAAFARAWVTSRHHGKGLARRALAGELRRRGVDGDTVGRALTEIDGATEEQTARELVERRLRSSPGGAPETLLRRLVGTLARKGYPAQLAYRVVKEVLATDARTAELADQIDVDALAEAGEEEDRLIDHNDD